MIDSICRVNNIKSKTLNYGNNMVPYLNYGTAVNTITNDFLLLFVSDVVSVVAGPRVE